MAIQIIDDPSRDAFGSALAQGLSGGLQNLMQHKMQAMQQQRAVQQTTNGLQALGFDPKQAQQLAQLDPQTLQLVVKQKLEEPNQRAYAQALSSLLGGEPMEQQQMAPVQQQLTQDRYGISPSQKVQLKKYLDSGKGKVPYSPEQLKKLESYLVEPAPAPMQPMQPQAEQQMKASSLGGLNAKQVTEIAKLGFEKQRLNVQERKLLHQMQKDALSETKELRKEILDKKKVARESIENLDRLEELEKEGLPGAGYVEFLKNAGLDVPALVGAPAEEYNKIAAGFLRGAKTMFGNRLTDADLTQFLKLLPSLSNSPEGRARINANLKRFYNLDLAAGQVYDEIIKSNKGIPPLDLDVQIDRKLDKKREAIAKQFKADLQKKVPKGESALATSLLSGSGKLISNIPKAAEGALKGAAVGSYIGSKGGPIGLTGGAIIGGISGLLGYAPSLKDVI